MSFFFPHRPSELPILPHVQERRNYVASQQKDTHMTAVDDVKKSVEDVEAKVSVVKEKADALSEAHKQFRAAVTDLVSVAAPPAA